MNDLERQLLLERSRIGDVQALGNLLNSFRPYLRVLVHAFCRQWHPPGLDDSDLIQDSLVEAQRCFPHFQGTAVHQLRGWLRQLALRTTGRTLRGLSQEAQAQLSGAINMLADDASSPSEQVIRHERALQVADALSRLPPDMRLVLESRHVEDLAHPEIAQRLQRTPEAVRQLYVRALRELRRLLQEDGKFIGMSS